MSHPQHFSRRLPTVCGLQSRLNSAPSSRSRLTVIVPCSVIHAACTFVDPLVLIVCCFSRFGFLVAMVTRLCTSPPAFVCGFSSFLSSSAGRPSLYASSWNQEHVARCQSAPLNMLLCIPRCCATLLTPHVYLFRPFFISLLMESS